MTLFAAIQKPKDFAGEGFRSSVFHGVVVATPIEIATEVHAVALFVLTTGPLMPFAALVGPFTFFGVRDCVRPGRGRHRFIARGRHAARGGRR